MTEKKLDYILGNDYFKNLKQKIEKECDKRANNASSFDGGSSMLTQMYLALGNYQREFENFNEEIQHEVIRRKFRNEDKGVGNSFYLGSDEKDFDLGTNVSFIFKSLYSKGPLTSLLDSIARNKKTYKKYLEKAKDVGADVSGLPNKINMFEIKN